MLGISGFAALFLCPNSNRSWTLPSSKIVIEDNLITRKEVKTYATQSRHIVIHDLWLYDTNI